MAETPATAPLSTSDRLVMRAAEPTAPLGAPTDTRRTQRWLIIAPIAASLAAMAAGWWLYRGEVADHGEITVQAATRAADDAAPVNRMPQGERAEALARELTMPAAAQHTAERTAIELREAVHQERDKAESLVRDLAAARREIETQTAAARAASGETTQLREDAMRATQELERSQQRERERADALERELATARRELETQSAALTEAGDKKVQSQQQLTELRQGLQQVETSAAAYRESLAQQRARNQELEQQLATRQDAGPGRSRNATASLPDTPGPTQAPAIDKPATEPLPTSDKAQLPATDKPAPMAARPPAPAPETPGPELQRLLSRASLLLSQGNIGTARIVLDRAAETGSAAALFALAETYDPIILAAWRTYGTQGDAAKAREFYARAFAGGVQEARERLNALPK